MWHVETRRKNFSDALAANSHAANEEAESNKDVMHPKVILAWQKPKEQIWQQQNLPQKAGGKHGMWNSLWQGDSGEGQF